MVGKGGEEERRTLGRRMQGRGLGRLVDATRRDAFITQTRPHEVKCCMRGWLRLVGVGVAVA